jgi:long-chain acyl-CoA synthetase
LLAASAPGKLKNRNSVVFQKENKMEQLWHKSYPKGMAYEIDTGLYESIPALFDEAFRKYADRNYAVCMDKTLTFKQLDSMSAKVGAWLQSKGLAAGARVAIMLPNILQFPCAMAGILRAGYVVVNVNPLYTARELEHQLKDSGAEAIIVLENFATTLEQIIDKTPVKHVLMCSMGDMLGFWKGILVNFAVRHVKKMVPAYNMPNAIRFNSAMADAERMSLKPTHAKRDDVAFLQYTGGTTGVSKGGVLTHGNVIAAMLQAEASMAPVLDVEPRPGQFNVVTALPLYHIYALAGCALLSLRQGNMMLLIPNPRDLPGFVKELAKRPFHVFPGLNTLFNGLANNADFQRLDFGPLRLTQAGGMATSEAVAAKWLGITGSAVVEGWGMSETCAIGTNNITNSKTFTGTIGIPLSSIDIVIRTDDNQPVPQGESGEMCIKGPNVMVGYWNRPDETKKSFTPDGYFMTGDIGFIDANGFIKIIDRKKDMVLVSGFNVFPTEIEGEVQNHPGVLECAVIGVPDVHAGEAVKLFVVRKDPTLTEEALRQFCNERLTGYKRPKYIEFRDDLPKSNVGKILRKDLRDKKAA